MKKEGKKIILIFIILLLFLTIVPFLSSQEKCGEDCKVDKAYTCLQNKIDDKTCSQLTSEEKVFSLMALGKCKDEVANEVSDGNYDNNIKLTAQAILGLKEIGASTDEVASWLSSRNMTFTDLIWYLQIESNEATSCEISYDNSQYTITIDENKKLSGNVGNCLTRANDDYWLEISSNCYGKEFSIKCDKSFVTSLLYKKQDSSLIYVSGTTNSASPGGTITEKVNSLCFRQGASCDYEGSLWAALALDSLSYDISPYIPYLISMMDENEKYLPEAFLLMLTGGFKIDLLAKQKSVNDQYYWDESGDKYYDTALALFPFQYEEPTEKVQAKEWLLSSQTEEGCWNNIRNTAFILYSLWHDKAPIVPVEKVSCEDAGYFCLSSMNCQEAGGDVLDEYSCSGTYVCCSEELKEETCSEKGGEICSEDEECDGMAVDASDLSSKEICCIGDCKKKEAEISDCELVGGICRISCYKGEKEIFESCKISSDVCCVKEEKKSYLGIIILGILIVLVALGIIFRKKLRELWLKFKSRKGKGPTTTGLRPGPRFPPSRPVFSRPSVTRPTKPIPRRVIPKPHKELDEVLKKLKEMGKK